MDSNKAPGTSLQTVASDFLPVLDIGQAVERRNAITQYVKQLMVNGTDYGKIPGIEKPTLLKPGAEKLVTFFGLSPEFICEERVEDWTGADHKGEAFFYYRYKCRLTRNSKLIGEGVGSCNSWEAKYRYRWVRESDVPEGMDRTKLPKRDGSSTEFEFAINKAETTGKYGKPIEYWQKFKDAIAAGTAVYGMRKTSKGESPAYTIPDVQYRVPNTDAADVVNTIQKMSQKRALIAAVLIGVNASEFFTQDVEDMHDIEVPATVTKDEPMVRDADKGRVIEQTNDKFINADQFSVLLDELAELTNGEARLKHAMKLERLTMIPVEDYNNARDWIKRQIARDKEKS